MLLQITALGKLHPLIVHMPIALAVVLPLLWIAERLFSKWKFPQSVYFVLWVLMLITTQMSIMAGQQLEESGGYPHDLLEAHEQGAFVVLGITILGLFISGLNLFWTRFSTWKKFQWLPMLLAFVAVSFTGHKGGALTHGEQYLDEVYGLFSPSEKSENDTTEMVRKRFTEIDSALVYEDMVKPLLEENCVACHGAKKQNGGLRMDSISTILKASNSGQMCISGSAQKSELIHRMELDMSNIRRMPPETDPIPESQIAILKFWIDQGLPSKTKVVKMSISESVRKAMEEEFSQPYTPKVYSKKIPEADPKAIERARAAGFLVSKVYQENGFLEVRTAGMKPEEIAGNLNLLKPISIQISRLDVSFSTLQKSDFQWIGSFPNLERLSLRQASFDPDLLSHLEKLPFLEFLNLSGTGISNPAQMPNLGKCKVVLGQTKSL